MLEDEAPPDGGTHSSTRTVVGTDMICRPSTTDRRYTTSCVFLTSGGAHGRGVTTSAAAQPASSNARTANAIPKVMEFS
jgi:hypothetical protein